MSSHVVLRSYSSVLHIFIVFIVSFGSSIYLGQAHSVPDCIIYTFNATTNRLECAEINDIDVGSSKSSESDRSAIQNLLLFSTFIIVMCIAFYCCKNCGGPSFGRFRHEDELNNVWQGSSTPVFNPLTTPSNITLGFPHLHQVVSAATSPINNSRETQTPENIGDSEPPEYQPPPSYNECVMINTNNDSKKV
ncbi:unnamed protein product [Orchesella dallaii]|uniref:Uncharacterized protein n=1 Tax=Orchesella dallaii TaxID=48710 RepID=A0ABP1S8E1_9HEXA